MKGRVIAVVWGLAVAAGLLVSSFPVRDRLPEPMATHWGMGARPDGANSFTGHVTTVLIIWAVLWTVLVAAGVRTGGRRGSRMTVWGGLSGAGVLMLGANASTLSVNLGASHWTAALLPGWHIPAVFGAAILAAALAGYLGRGAPDERAPGTRVPPPLRLRSGQRTVWVSRTVNRWLAALTAGALAATIVVAGLTVSSVPWSGGALVPALVIVLLLGLATMSVTVRAAGDAVVIGFGPAGWPVRRIPLAKIGSAWSEELSPGEVGGWGFRGLPGRATIMLRGGECLVLGYRSGGRLAISVDDAERGASLINALIAERVES